MLPLLSPVKIQRASSEMAVTKTHALEIEIVRSNRPSARSQRVSFLSLLTTAALFEIAENAPEVISVGIWMTSGPLRGACAIVIVARPARNASPDFGICIRVAPQQPRNLRAREVRWDRQPARPAAQGRRSELTGRGCSCVQDRLQ